MSYEASDLTPLFSFISEWSAERNLCQGHIR